MILETMPRDSPEDDGEDSDNDNGKRGDPDGSSEQQLVHVRFSYTKCLEWCLVKNESGVNSL